MNTKKSATTTKFHQDTIGRSESFLLFQEQLSRVAKVDRPVLLIGERGTGKELAANRLHYLSNRWQQKLITLNCAAMTPSLFVPQRRTFNLISKLKSFFRNLLGSLLLFHVFNFS